MRGQKETRPCAACGTLLTRLLSQAKGANWYCNSRCQASHMPPPGSVSREPNPYRGQRETRPCANCGAEVTRYLTPRRIAQPWFCSRACLAQFANRERIEDGTWNAPRKPRRGDTVPCATCGQPFYRQPAYIKQNRRYCSKACAYEAMRVNQIVKPCAYCGKDMRLALSESHFRFCSRRCERLSRIKRPTGREHNGRPVIQNAQGYLTIYEPIHPAAHKHNGRVLEHRWVVEQAIGRYLTPGEQVDHINQDKADNRLENLQILSPRDHTLKTTADRMAEIRRLRLQSEQLAEYERRFGPLS